MRIYNFVLLINFGVKDISLSIRNMKQKKPCKIIWIIYK